MNTQEEENLSGAYVVIAGAGISMDPPSNLPSWWQYNKKIIDVIKEQTCALCPEAYDLVKKIDIEKGLPVQSVSEVIVSEGAGASYFTLLELLNAANPNANHFALAELAKKGVLHAIITTNFDTLIEAAFMREAVPLSTIVRDETYYEVQRLPGCQLFKIHGTVDDYESLIDTVRQKAVGLSPAKHFILEKILERGKTIIVIGFSGADLDFGLDYIPISQAIQEGSKIIWVVHPGTKPNPNVRKLKELYPDSIRIYQGDCSSLFQSLGIKYDEINVGIAGEESEDSSYGMEKKIRELFTSPYIGKDGCAGYCMSLLEMMGANEEALQLAELYEKTIDFSAVNIFSVTGLFALARQKMNHGKLEESLKYWLVILECLNSMEKLTAEVQEKYGKEQKKELFEARKKELIMNFGGTYNNLGLCSFHMNELDDAKNYFEEAKKIVEKESASPLKGIVYFNLARVNFIIDRDYDKYLSSLKKSAVYVKKTGNLSSLVEILIEECRVRLEIGEYHLAENLLGQIYGHLKNIGSLRLHVSADLRKAEYLLRIGRIKESCELLEKLSAIQGAHLNEVKKFFAKKKENSLPYVIINSLPEEKYRNLIVQMEYKKEKKLVPWLFLKLCINYIEKENWERVYDVAKCYYASADTDEDRSAAEYFLGCASMEKQDFSEAFSHFQAVIEYGGRASQNHLGWAYIECGKMNVQKGDVQTGEQYYYLGKNILKCKESENDMVNACTAYISSIFQAGYMEKGIQYTDELYEEISDVELRRKVEAWRETNVGDKKGNKRNEELSSQMASPEEIANEAQRLHESKEDREQAWALIRLASERYQQNGNMAGVGKCENNMGYFCMEEGKNAEAVTYFKKALDIKKLLNDVNGVVRQLINILAMFTRNKDMENAGKIVEYVRANLPEYEKTIEKYRLFFALAQYYMLQQNFAEAIYYGKRAEEGIEFLPEVGKAESQIVSEFVKQMESIFDDVKKENMNSNQFQVELNEAVRLYKTGKFSESCDKLETLERENKGNCMSLGIIKGTLGNACLNEKQFQKAIVHFEDAKRLFLRVKSENISESREHYFTAVNGIVLAMDGLKRREEAILILRRELKSDELTDKAKFTHVEPI